MGGKVRVGVGLGGVMGIVGKLGVGMAGREGVVIVDAAALDAVGWDADAAGRGLKAGCAAVAAQVGVVWAYVAPGVTMRQAPAQSENRPLPNCLLEKRSMFSRASRSLPSWSVSVIARRLRLAISQLECSISRGRSGLR